MNKENNHLSLKEHSHEGVSNYGSYTHGNLIKLTRSNNHK